MIHARPIHPHKTKQLSNSFGLAGLAPVAWHKLRLSLYIFSRILFVPNLSKSGLAYLQEMNNITIYKYSRLDPSCQHSRTAPMCPTPHGSHMQLPTYSPIHYHSL